PAGAATSGRAFFFSSRRRHTSFSRDWSSDVCSSDLYWRDLVYTVVARLCGARVLHQVHGGAKPRYHGVYEVTPVTAQGEPRIEVDRKSVVQGNNGGRTGLRGDKGTGRAGVSDQVIRR